MMKNYYLRQIRVSGNLYKAIKIYCTLNSITLKNFYDEMFTWFLNNQPDIYQASYKKGKIMSLWLSEEKICQTKKLATINNVSEARIVFTALMAYAQYKNINQPA